MAPEPAGTTAGSIYGPWRDLLEPEEVRAWSRPRPWLVARDVALNWLAILAAWTLVAAHPSWWTVATAAFIVGNRYYALFVIGHDGLHRRLFSRLEHNDLFNDLLILGPVGAITRINNQNHLRHHRLLARPEDPDRHKYGCFNKQTAGALATFLTGVGGTLRTMTNVYGRRLSAGDDAEGESRRYGARDLAILAGWQCLLVGGLTAAIGWWAYPALWLAPVFLFTFLCDQFRSFAEHSQPEADRLADTHRLITYLPPLWERILFAPANMNYHAAHHLWPSIPYFNLPRADAALRRLAGSAGLEWRRTYVGYLWRYARALPIADCSPATSS